MDARSWGLIIGVMAVLGIATLVGQFLKSRTDSRLDPALIQTFNNRVRAWWMLLSLLAVTFLLHRSATVILFFIISFWALREFITLTPSRTADHRALFWVFFFITPLQYVLVYFGEEQYGLYTVAIPVYAFLLIPMRIAFAGDYKRFLERTATIQAGLMVCVFCLSHAPALLALDIARYEGENAGLLLFLLLVVQVADALTYVTDHLVEGHVIAPAISPSKTWQGFAAGVGSGGLLGMTLFWATPFNPWQALCMALVISVTGFAGGMTMSAIKRDRGATDYGTLVIGHVGILDRLDSVCFAAPIFFHLTRFFANDFITP